ncbi:hypothetical protein PMAYCL1PPCAC_14060, partial [Pristionchus mayeri]
DAKYCAEVITHDGRRQLLEMPTWQVSHFYKFRKYSKKLELLINMIIKVTEIIVRQHCWATIYYREIHEVISRRYTLTPSGYGKHQVA